MKKLILLLIVMLISLVGYTQVATKATAIPVVSVPDGSTRFGRAWNDGFIVFKRDTKQLYYITHDVTKSTTMADVISNIWYDSPILTVVVDSGTFVKLYADSAGINKLHINDSLMLDEAAVLYFNQDETITLKDLNGLQTSGSWTTGSGDTLFTGVVSTTGNVNSLGTLNHFSGAGAGAATGVITSSSNGTPQLILNDLDATDAQEPMWYLQSANNASKGVFYLGYGDRSSGTTMTGYTDVMVVDPNNFGFGSANMPYHKISTYAATPVWALTNTTVNKNVTSAVQAIDSSAIAFDISGEPTIKWRASDGDAGEIAINTSDQLVASGFGGGVDIDGAFTAGTVTSDAGVSGTTVTGSTSVSVGSQTITQTNPNKASINNSLDVADTLFSNYFKANTGASINEFSTDGTLAGNSDLAVPTEKAVKTYVPIAVDSVLAAYGFDLWYGVQWNVTSSATPVTQIGDATMIATLPVHTGITYGLVKNDKTVNYYLDESDFTKRANGDASDLTGADGQVMMIMPSFYERWEQDGNTVRYKISPYALSGFTLVPSYAIGIFEGYKDGSDTLCSVYNQTPTTSVTRANFRTYAAKRGTDWSQLSYEAYKTLTMLYLVEEADWNSQDAGTLGDGMTNANGTDWSEYNAYSPVMTTGQNLSSGAYTGSKALSVNNWYAGTCSATKTDTVVDASRFATSWVAGYVGDTIVNATTGDSATITAKLSNDQLEVSAIGSGTGVFTNGDRYYILNSTLSTQIAYYRGVENVFGHLYKWVDGINIYANRVFTCQNPAQFTDNDSTNYTYRGTAPTSNGWITRLFYGSIIPQSISGAGAGSSTWMCDYYYQSTGWRVAAWGGYLSNGASAGLWYASFSASSGVASADVGARLCLKIE